MMIICLDVLLSVLCDKHGSLDFILVPPALANPITIYFFCDRLLSPSNFIKYPIASMAPIGKIYAYQGHTGGNKVCIYLHTAHIDHIKRY